MLDQILDRLLRGVVILDHTLVQWSDQIDGEAVLHRFFTEHLVAPTEQFATDMVLCVSDIGPDGGTDSGGGGDGGTAGTQVHPDIDDFAHLDYFLLEEICRSGEITLGDL